MTHAVGIVDFGEHLDVQRDLADLAALLGFQEPVCGADLQRLGWELIRLVVPDWEPRRALSAREAQEVGEALGSLLGIPGAWINKASQPTADDAWNDRLVTGRAGPHALRRRYLVALCARLGLEEPAPLDCPGDLRDRVLSYVRGLASGATPGEVRRALGLSTRETYAALWRLRKERRLVANGELRRGQPVYRER